MALFHLHVTQVKRSAGQSVVTSAAYRAGEKLYSEYYGEVSDYTHKGGVVCTDILLPPQAPNQYQDRATLWNAVEKAERGKKAQLAYSFDIALQNEFSLEENIALARQFVSEQLVGRGMIADFAIHQPDKEDGGIPNPHFHVLCPIRPIEPDGKWGCKQRRRYRLDEDGNRIMGEDGKPLFDAVPTTDWGSPETLEHWREAWAAMVNAKFEEKGLTCRIDHRSYERQGLDLLPTVHEGVAVRQMEAKGIPTDKGDLNRWIKKANNILRDIRKKIAGLTDWIKAIKEELSKPQAPTLAALLTDYYEGRNAGAWSRNARIGNLKGFAEAINFLTERGIATLEDLETHIAAQSERTEAINTSMKAKRDRLNELKELLRLVDLYRDTKPVYDELQGIKWKGKREKFEREHENELRTFHMARRKLDKHRSPAGKIPVHAWEQEQARLHQEYTAEYEQYKPKAVSTQFVKARHEFVTPQTVKQIHKVLRNAFNQGVKWELMSRNPVEHATLPKAESKKRDIWTAETLIKALELCDDELLSLAINLAFSCSLRMGELLGLTWNCVDISPVSIEQGRASIFVEKELQRVNRDAMKNLNEKDILFKFPRTFASTHTALVLKTPKTKTSVRKVFLPKTVAEMLVARKEEIEELKEIFGDEFVDYDLVFCSSNGKPVEGQIINRAFSKLIEDNGLPRVVFHSLRHSSITYKLKLNGGDMKSVQGDSGHAQVKMVADVYSHIIDDDRRLNAERMEAAFYSGRMAEPNPVPASTTTEESPSEDQELLLKLLRNPEMAALLKSLAKTL